jgi:glc operon protein GlcG
MTTMSTANARRYVDKALAIADERKAPIAVVVVDRGGTIIAAARTDSAAPFMVELARRKAALSAAVGTATKLIMMMAANDPALGAGLRSVPEYLLLPGAMPVIGPGGVPEGAVGIAGGHYEIDDEICEATVRSDIGATSRT